MAPLVSLLLLLAFALSTVIASPHIARNVHPHAHRAVHAGVSHRDLNKRCIPRPSNSTTFALPTSTGPPFPSSSLPTSSYAPPTTSEAPSPTSSPATTSSPSSSSAPATTYSPTTSSAPATTYSPTTSSTPPPPTTTTTPTSSAPPAQTSSPSDTACAQSYMCGTQYGMATYYAVGLGACGQYSVDTDFIAAVDISLFDSYPQYNGANPNTNPICGKKITAYYGGSSVTVTVLDACEGCKNTTSIDFSPSAFSVLADQSVGTMPISWDWVS